VVDVVSLPSPSFAVVDVVPLPSPSPSFLVVDVDESLQSSVAEPLPSLSVSLLATGAVVSAAGASCCPSSGAAPATA
jgi:hypothetical protein